MGKRTIPVLLGDTELKFNVDNDDVNKYLNQQMPNEKVQSAYNLLSRTVDDKDKDNFKKLALDGTSPRGVVVMQVATLVASQFGGDLEITIKKPSKSSKGSEETDSAS